MMTPENLATFGDVLAYLETHGIGHDHAQALVTTVFGWGVSAAMGRMHPIRAAPADAPAVDLPLGDAAPLAAKPARKPKGRVVMAVRPIPDDFILTAERGAYATGRGFNRGQVVEMFEDFTGYFRKTGKRWADWDAAWQGWVRNQVKRANDQRGPDHPSSFL